MSRVLLVVPVHPMGNATPSLGIAYLAASLLDRGHVVEVFDPSAPYGPPPAALAERVLAFGPDMVGGGLFTDSALATYELMGTLDCGDALRVAGGVHATAEPEEALAQGFDVAVVGEGEQTLVDLADLLDGAGRWRDRVAEVPGLLFRDGTGEIRRSARRPRLDELDRLPPPHLGTAVFPRQWYLAGGRGTLPAHLLTSRGCPGACVFCSNQVTGRRHRVHSVGRVVREVRAQFEREGPGLVSFHDDAFTAQRARLLELLAAFGAELAGAPPWWWCESRVDHFDAEIAAAMKAGGCHTVVFGVESGHPDILRSSGKGIRPEQALRALAEARDAGLVVYANFMLGFPEERPAHLDATLNLMQRAAAHVHMFSPLGLVVPYPGTPLYARHAQTFGFERWWLDPARVGAIQAPMPAGGYAALDAARIWGVLAELEEGLLEADFFRYAPETREAIRRCLRFRQQHNAPVRGMLVEAGADPVDELSPSD